MDLWSYISLKIRLYNRRISRDRLAQMVERALWKFSPQREVVQIPPAPGFFHLELKYISLRRDLESSKNVMEFGHIPMIENQSVFKEWAKREI